MKNAAITGPRQCAVLEVPEPKAVPPFCLVEVAVTPMCTEFHQYKEGHSWWRDLGHEAAGTILESPPGARLKPGQRVVVMPQNGCGSCPMCLSGDHCRCVTQLDPAATTGVETGRATYAQRMIQQEWLLLPLPDDISFRHGCMAGCGLGPAFAACQAMNVGPLDTVLVSGLGPVGLGAVVNAAVRGARVIGVEANPYRAALAKELGADAVVSPGDEDAAAQVLDLTQGRGADKSIECSSAEAAPAFAVACTRINGQFTSVGWGGPIRAADIVRRGVAVRGVWHWNHLTDAEAMFWTIRKAGPLLDKLITHEFALDQVQDAWELQLTGECGKVLLMPNGPLD